MSNLYPLKFKSIFKEKIWGGQKIRTVLGKDFGDLNNCGETWELSGVKGNVSVVSNGSLEGQSLADLIKTYQERLLGGYILKRFGNEFPLLIKFIDAAQDLSIQVHPNDELAELRHASSGKNEIWYIIQADEGSSLVSGFNRKIDREQYLSYLNDGRLEDILNRVPVKEKDVFFLPAGRVHTIGAGLLLAEIQQTSEITYRIYDFERVDRFGKKRELHTDAALEAIDFSKVEDCKTHYLDKVDTTNEIIITPYFTTNKLTMADEIQLDRADIDCFKIYIGVNGSGSINGESISKGDVILLPAEVKKTVIRPNDKLELLETYVHPK